MMRLRDSFTLAFTKLRTRKVRLTVTVVISGLLFCGLVAASLVARGAFESVDSFNNEGFGKRYIVQANHQEDYSYMQDDKVMDRALAIHKEIVAAKKATAKSLDIEYSESMEQLPVQTYDTPAGKMRNLDIFQPAAQQAVKELYSAKKVDASDLEKLAKPYKGIKSYESVMYTPSSDGSTLKVLDKGKENLDQSGEFKGGSMTGIDSFTNAWTLMSDELLEPFILKDASLKDIGDGTVPIVIPVSAAEQLLGLKSLSDTAKPAAKLERMNKLRKEAADIRFQVCYRNTTSAGLINEAISTAQELERNKKNKDYVKPELIYGVPAQACGAAVVTRDVRDADTKALAVKQEKFDVMFGKKPAHQELLNFRVVGLSPDFNFNVSTGVSQIVSSLVTSSLGPGWYTPVQYKDTISLVGNLFNAGPGSFAAPPTYFEEFSTAANARSFIEKENCEPDYSTSNVTKAVDPFAKCNEIGKPFTVIAYGSNSLALDSAKKDFTRIFGIAAIVAAAIAAIIMMGTVGRMIADSRRETAVFRAIGAKKIDIAQVYILYTVLLALLICVFSIGVGMIVASVFNQKYSDLATVQALVSYGAQDLSRRFVFFSFNNGDIIKLIGLVVGASVLSSFLPLMRNLRRNPIRDMRDDT